MLFSVIFVVTGQDVQALEEEGFALEQHIEALIEMCPAALAVEADATDIRFVARQVGLGAGIADVVLLDAEMRLTLVEVKRGQNAEARREVVGQAFDYVSALADMTFEEVDRSMAGALARTVATFAEADSDADENAHDPLEDLRRTCAANLRAGRIRVAVVVDEAPPDLQRIIGYLARRANLDIRLVSLAQYKLPGGAMAVVPRVLVGGIDPAQADGVGSSAQNPWLIDFFERFPYGPDEEPFNNTAKLWRQIRIGGWPATLHYEVLTRKRGNSIELHVENGQYRDVFNLLMNEIDSIKQQVGAEIIFSPDWVKVGASLIVKLEDSLTPIEATVFGRRFMDATRPIVQRALESRSALRP